MGGMDIFKAEFDIEGTLVSVTNMKSPINSPQDDFGIIFEEKRKRILQDPTVLMKRWIYRQNLSPSLISFISENNDANTNTIISAQILPY